MHPKSTRLCRGCKRNLPLEDFGRYIDSNGRNKGPYRSCKECRERYRVARMRPKKDRCQSCGTEITRGYKMCRPCRAPGAYAIEEPNPSGLCMCGCGEKTRLAPQTNSATGTVRGKPLRYIAGHQGTKDPTRPENYVVNKDTGCWEWAKSVTSGGYGSVCVNAKTSLAHRVFYERLVGPIPEGCEIDHLCRNRRCVNPDHLEAVPRSENLRRGDGTILTVDQVREIRRLWDTGRYRRREIAEMFGIASTTVQMVVHRHSWKDVH